MSEEVVRILPGFGERSVDAILEIAKNADMEKVIVMGMNKEGELYFNMSMSDLRDALWIIEQTKARQIII